MSTDNWFAALTFLAVYLIALMLLDGAHKAHIAALKQKLEVQNRFDYIIGNPPFGSGVSSKPEHIQWLPPFGDSAEHSEEYDSNEE